MNRSSLLLPALAAGVLLAAPAGALAKGSVIAGPFKAKGYSLTLNASDGGSVDSLYVTAVKRKGGSSQLHSWSFKDAKVTVSGANATIKGSLGRYGKINAKVRTTSKVKGIVPAGCKGSAGSARRGTMTGATKLVLDSTYFKTVKPGTLKAQILNAGKLDCAPTGGSTDDQHGLTLMGSSTNEAGTLSVTIAKAGSKVTQTVMRSDAAAATAPASVFHIITATTGDSGLHPSPDFQNASAPAAGPFLLGQLAFAGEVMGSMTMGTITGDFAANFDSIGRQALPEDTDGMLMQR